jgi:Tfp pilus assembly ATPase PilU
MIDERNETLTGHILTVEDPIEYQFRNKKSIVNQREVGTDTSTLATALKNALRQAPDVILIGEIRDRETMSAALAYAQSGHLCWPPCMPTTAITRSTASCPSSPRRFAPACWASWPRSRP